MIFFNDISYKHANRNVIFYRLHKMTKSGILWRYENIDTQIHSFVFLCSSKYKLFPIDILHLCGIHQRLHSDLLSEFFETSKYDFCFFKKSMVSMCTKSSL